MDFDLTPVFFNLLSMGCVFWIVMVAALLIFLNLSRLLNWRWMTWFRRDESDDSG